MQQREDVSSHNSLQQPGSAAQVAPKPNNTGIPQQLKEGFEAMSGCSFDDVRVHYSSEKPIQFRALAYTQGSRIYIRPGQEHCLRHELGHVVQQKLGMVKPTRYQDGVGINDDAALERQADSGHIPGVHGMGESSSCSPTTRK